MKKDLEKKQITEAKLRMYDLTEKSKPGTTTEKVLYDECGDTMWDPVLAHDSQIFPSYPALKGE